MVGRYFSCRCGVLLACSGRRGLDRKSRPADEARRPRSSARFRAWMRLWMSMVLTLRPRSWAMSLVGLPWQPLRCLSLATTYEVDMTTQTESQTKAGRANLCRAYLVYE